MNEQKFRKLAVWEKSMNFIVEIYNTTTKFPAKEIYGLVNQIRRSATSIALNIAEGSGASSDIEFNRFLNISLRSSYETMCGIEIANRLKYCTDSERNDLLKKCDQIAAMLFGLKKKLKNKI